MQTAVVTGGAGFIGSHLVDKLIKQGIKVIILDNLSTGKKENINPKATFYNLDISNIDILRLQSIIEGTDIVFHLATLARVQPSIEQPLPYHDANVTGTHNLLVAAARGGVKKFIFSSSSSVYGNASTPTSETHPKNPISPYALHKLMGEQYCKLFSTLYDIDTVSLRYFNVYGDRMNLEGAYRLAIPIFASQIKEGRPCTINNDGEQRRDFTYVGDVVDANIKCALNKKRFDGDVFNIGNGNNTSVNKLVDMLGGEKGKGMKVVEPFETLADNTKALLNLDWDPQGDLPTWINNYKKELGI
jgi:UDP-glucose 4-epimerase